MHRMHFCIGDPAVSSWTVIIPYRPADRMYYAYDEGWHVCRAEGKALTEDGIRTKIISLPGQNFRTAALHYMSMLIYTCDFLAALMGGPSDG